MMCFFPPPKTHMSPENTWLEDAFPIEIVPFLVFGMIQMKQIRCLVLEKMFWKVPRGSFGKGMEIADVIWVCQGSKAKPI